jgi:hypothetical protein
MSDALFKALAALLPAFGLLAGSATLFFRGKSLASFMQLFGAGCLLVAVLTHVCEALRLFPTMRWGRQDSPGHYVDFWSVALGLTLFPLGYLFYALARRNTQQI